MDKSKFDLKQSMERFMPSGFRRVVLSFDCEAAYKPIQYINQYQLSATIGVDFKSTDADLARAQKHASIQIFHYLHRESLILLDDIRSAVYAGDAEKVLQLCDKMQKEMVGE